jgi:hypothetical protein
MAESILVTKAQARRFMLAHHYLLPPRKLKGKAGILEYLDRVGSIQFDSINVVGGNPDLVMQSRFAHYQPKWLQELLYQERHLIDGWDKQASIFQTKEWPYFSRRRQAMREYYGADLKPSGKLAVSKKIRSAIEDRGPLSSIDIKDDERIDWHWGIPASTTRAAMEALYAVGQLGIHHRVHTRRHFDLIENLLSGTLLRAKDPNPKEDEYLDWHLTRRIGSMGLAHPKAGESWSGLRGSYGGISAVERKAAMQRLIDQGRILQVAIKEVPKQIFYLRAVDLPALQVATRASRAKRRAAFIAPLDNLMWQRHVIAMLFDFEYTWEVYVPALKRKYGYYVLPVLYGDQLIARMDPKFHRDSQILKIKGWWWQSNTEIQDTSMHAAIAQALKAFLVYLGANNIELSGTAKQDAVIRQAAKLALNS